MIDLDRIDLRILSELQADGRLTNAALAQRVNLSASACLRRVQRLEQRRVIERYAALLDLAQLGKGTDAFVEVTLGSQREEVLSAFEQAIRECPEVLECHLMSGGSDYLLHVAVADTRDYERIHRQYLSRLPHVARIRSSFALRTVCKRNGVEL
ncbi:MAG TPA: Lrp/AsnC family transcriptional regulator [Burkholderiaceae bacterium]|nr:Lrp/AsnC family transcriptional regulator [Burkholderiaceae bacterium]